MYFVPRVRLFQKWYLSHLGKLANSLWWDFIAVYPQIPARGIMHLEGARTGRLVENVIGYRTKGGLVAWTQENFFH